MSYLYLFHLRSPRHDSSGSATGLECEVSPYGVLIWLNTYAHDSIAGIAEPRVYQQIIGTYPTSSSFTVEMSSCELTSITYKKKATSVYLLLI